jgi:hypothetical protein
MTSDGSPAAIFGCACKIPSKIQSTPNPMRSSHRPLASPGSSRRLSAAPAVTSASLDALASPLAGFAPGVVIRQVRAVAQMSQRSTTAMRAIAPWWSSADLKAATTVGSSGLRA